MYLHFHTPCFVHSSNLPHFRLLQTFLSCGFLWNCPSSWSVRRKGDKLIDVPTSCIGPSLRNRFPPVYWRRYFTFVILVFASPRYCCRNFHRTFLYKSRYSSRSCNQMPRFNLSIFSFCLMFKHSHHLSLIETGSTRWVLHEFSFKIPYYST